MTLKVASSTFKFLTLMTKLSHAFSNHFVFTSFYEILRHLVGGPRTSSFATPCMNAVKTKL